MRFWDSSAIVPLLVEESSTGRMQSLLDRDRDVTVWWATEVECFSAITRRERQGLLGAAVVAAALTRLKAFASAWDEVQPTSILRETAGRFVRVHPIRAADALQLAAAFTAAETRPATLEVVALDERLAAAAAREGFILV